MVQLQVLAHIFSPGVPHVSNFRKIYKYQLSHTENSIYYTKVQKCMVGTISYPANEISEYK